MATKIYDAICVGSNDKFSTFYSESNKRSYNVRNQSIKTESLPQESRESNGSVKIGTQAILFELCYPTGNCYFIDNPSRNKQTEMEISFGQEGTQLEFKSSLHHVCDPRIDNEEGGNRPAQYRILAEELCAFANAHDSGVLVIGVKDDGKLTEHGLNLEVEDIIKEESQLRNYFSQVLSVTFTSRLHFVWERPGGKLILKIIAPKWEGDVLLVSGTDLFIRSGSNCQRVKGLDLITFIRNHAVSA